MSNIDTLMDPRRTVPAGKLGSKIHVVKKVGREYSTLCYLPVKKQDLMVFAQTEGDITCKTCKTSWGIIQRGLQ